MWHLVIVSFVGFLGLVALGVWCCTVVVVVRHGEQVLLEQWGVYKQTLGEGLWALVPLRDHLVVPQWSCRVENAHGGTETVSQRDWRIRTCETDYDQPPLKCVTRDGLWATVNLTTTYIIENPYKAAYQVTNMWRSLQDLLETTLVSLVRERDSNGLRSHELEQAMLEQLKSTARWGVRVLSVRLQDIKLPKTIEAASESSIEQRRKDEARNASLESANRLKLTELRFKGALELEQREQTLRKELGELDALRQLAEVKRAQEMQEQLHRAQLQENALAMARRESENLEAMKTATYTTMRDSGLPHEYWLALEQQKTVAQLNSKCRVLMLPPETMAGQLGTFQVLTRRRKSDEDV